MSTNELGTSIDTLSSTLCQLLPNMSMVLISRLVKELRAGQITSQTKTDVMTAFQRAFDSTRAPIAETEVLSSLATTLANLNVGASQRN